MTDWTIHPLTLPEQLDADDAWGLHAVQRVTQAAETRRWGNDDFVDTIEARLAGLRNQAYTERVGLLAVPSGGTTTADAVVAFAFANLPRTDNTHRADVEVAVHPDLPPDAAGSVADALLRACDQVARERGRTTLTAFSETPGEPPEDDPNALEAPTGAGRVDGADTVAAALARAGFVLEQAERYSRLDLPVEPGLLDRLERAAQARAGTDYRLVRWEDTTPEHLLEQHAYLNRRMSTDAPRAGVELDEQQWDAARVRELDASIARRGYGYLLTAVEHLPSETLVAYTVLEYSHERPAPVYQDATLVLREHRGHRLGMLVKVANLRALTAVRPAARRVHTWNAEENAYMLDINVALGFRPAGAVGLWQRRL